MERALGDNLTAIEKRVKQHLKNRRQLHERLDRLPNGSPLFGLYPPPTKIPRKRNKRKNVSSSPPDPDVPTGPLPPMATFPPLYEQPVLPPFPVFSTGRPIASAADPEAPPPADDPPAPSSPIAKPESSAVADPAEDPPIPDDFEDDEDGMPIEDDEDVDSEDERRIAAFVPDPAPPEDWDREIRVIEKMRRPRGRGRGQRNI